MTAIDLFVYAVGAALAVIAVGIAALVAAVSLDEIRRLWRNR